LTRHVHPDAKITIADSHRTLGVRAPAKPAILHEDRIVTYAELDQGANRYARWALSAGPAQRRRDLDFDGEQAEYLAGVSHPRTLRSRDHVAFAQAPADRAQRQAVRA